MSESYLAQGQEEVWFVETLTTPATPTKVLIEAGTAFMRMARAFNPPSYAGNSVDATPIGAKSPSSLDGLPSITNSSASFLVGDTATADTVVLFQALKALEKTSGYLVLAPRGRIGIEDDAEGEVTTGDLVHVFPAKVNTVALDANGAQDPKTFTVTFTHAGRFYEAVTVVAS